LLVPSEKGSSSGSKEGQVQTEICFKTFGSGVLRLPNRSLFMRSRGVK